MAQITPPDAALLVTPNICRKIVINMHVEWLLEVAVVGAIKLDFAV
jgi:hypothetical protein